MASSERAALTAFSLSKPVRLALAKDQDPGPAIERPREQHTLLLATGERRTHVPDQALVAHRHAFNVDSYLCQLGAHAHELHVDLVVEAGDVLGERALQQAVVLRDQGDLAAKTLRVPTVERLAVDQHPAAGGFADPGNDVGNLRVVWQASPQWRASLEIENLADTLYADRADFAQGDWRYFPARQRSVFVNVVWQSE